MTDLYSPVERKTTSLMIAERLREAIISGEIARGERLPSERELAEKMGVSRPGIREAISMLSSYGLIQSRQGGGNFVADRFAESVFGFLGFYDSLNEANYEYFFECRILMETGVIPLVFTHITPEKIEELRAVNAVFLSETKDEDFVTAEILFHSTFFAVCGNPLMVELYKMVLKFMQESATYLLGTKAIRTEAYEAHAKILDALERGEVSACEAAVREHLEVARGNLRDYFAKEKR